MYVCVYIYIYVCVCVCVYIYISQCALVCFHLTPSQKKFVARSIRIFSVCAAFNPIRVFSLRMIEAEIATSINVA
jgi:hypothetical protein